MNMEKTKLEICAETFPQTDIWMDSFSVRDHEYAVAHHCRGVTTSPTWVGHMLCDEFVEQKPLLQTLIRENPAADEREIAWKWTLEMGRQRRACMLPEWEKGDPRRGDVYKRQVLCTVRLTAGVSTRMLVNVTVESK